MAGELALRVTEEVVARNVVDRFGGKVADFQPAELRVDRHFGR